MKNKKSVYLVVVLVLAALVVVTGALIWLTGRNYQEVHKLEFHDDIGGAETQKSTDLCPNPLSKVWSRAGNYLEIQFKEERVIFDVNEGDPTAYITVDPPVLMLTLGYKRMFNDFRLEDGQVMTVYLAEGGSMNILNCSGTLYAEWGKG
jgi:hypothetical protein